jgi:hypothetical protein
MTLEPRPLNDTGCLGTITILALGVVLWWIVFGVFDVPLYCSKGHWLGKQYTCDYVIPKSNGTGDEKNGT